METRLRLPSSISSVPSLRRPESSRSASKAENNSSLLHPPRSAVSVGLSLFSGSLLTWTCIGADAVDKGLTPPATPKKPKATPKPRAKKSKAKITEDDSPNNDLNDDVFASAFGNTVKKEADLDEEEYA